jgi:hypothetical protein
MMAETNKKYHIEKNTVQETLVIPLYGRKVCSEHFPTLFKDKEAERICNMLDYDFSEKSRRMESSVGLFGALEVAQRQCDIACEVRDYLNLHPEDAGSYECLKEELCSKYPEDRDSYVTGKKELVTELLAKAKRWREEKGQNG